MKNDLINSAYFIEDKDDTVFYHNLFLKLKKEINFDFCAFYYKKGKYFCVAKEGIEDNSLFTLKIPIKNSEIKIGYFLLQRKTPFTKEEKQKISGDIYWNKIKDYEISKIFKNQLSILQEAIIEKTKLQKKLEEKNEELIKIDKTRTEFLANVSHELRTPLNSIIGFSDGLIKGACGELNDKQKFWTGKILSSAIHLTGIINTILDMTKIEARAMNINLKAVNPHLLTKEVINTLEPLAGDKNIKIELKSNVSNMINLDELKFKQIMFNLLGNAIKFSYENSKVIIKLRENENFLIVKIKDFGIGIDKKNHKRIFEKFVQLDNIYTKTSSSTGLGLTITNELIKMHNGKISLKSSLNKGCEFTLCFPK